ncbi:MAG: NADP oxidoreductase [Frankiales bacterium]|nr:NADP oxidoreductase [Frankiales bacterium]
MRIGFIGSGRIGSNLARLAVAQGHDVVMSNSRGPQTLDQLVAELGPHARAATVAEAADEGEVVVVTVPLKAIDAVPAEPLRGKVVVDTCNYYTERDGEFAELDAGRTTSSELLASRLPGARVVKAFNAIYFEHLIEHADRTGPAGRRALPIAGDDDDAKKVVTGLIESFGFDVVDAGPLSEGRRFQPDTPAYGADATADELRTLLGR